MHMLFWTNKLCFQCNHEVLFWASHLMLKQQQEGLSIPRNKTLRRQPFKQLCLQNSTVLGSTRALPSTQYCYAATPTAQSYACQVMLRPSQDHQMLDTWSLKHLRTFQCYYAIRVITTLLLCMPSNDFVFPRSLHVVYMVPCKISSWNWFPLFQLWHMLPRCGYSTQKETLMLHLSQKNALLQ